jgi:tetratricopeptide (TPR) repeat protein
MQVTRLIAIVVITLSTVPRIASAQPEEDATALKAEGDALFDRGRYADAFDAYQRAYTKRPEPALLYNQARALESMGEYPESLDRLEEFSRSAPPDVRAKVPKLDALMEELRSRICTVHVTTNARGAHLLVRGRDLGALDADKTVRVRAGEASLRVVADGYEPFTRDLGLPGGGKIDVDAKLKTSSTNGSAAGGEAVTSKWWFWTAIGAVVVGSATVMALALTSEKDPEKGTFSPSPVRVQARF